MMDSETHRSMSMRGTFAWYVGRQLQCLLLQADELPAEIAGCNQLLWCRMAPELLTQGHCTAKADVYSLGVLSLVCSPSSIPKLGRACHPDIRLLA